MNRKLSLAILGAMLAAAAAMPDAAHATGYVRVGDKCFFILDNVSIQIGCPDEVSENPRVLGGVCFAVHPARSGEVRV